MGTHSGVKMDHLDLRMVHIPMVSNQIRLLNIVWLNNDTTASRVGSIAIGCKLTTGVIMTTFQDMPVNIKYTV